MTINATLKGAELANYLAITLSDLEFELLVRSRIKNEFARLHRHEPNLSESYNTCRFGMSWSDESEWHVRVGENYNKSAEVDGQVLSRCCSDVAKLYEMKNGNKLSLLLPAPETDVDVEDKKW